MWRGQNWLGKINFTVGTGKAEDPDPNLYVGKGRIRIRFSLNFYCNKVSIYHYVDLHKKKNKGEFYSDKIRSDSCRFFEGRIRIRFFFTVESGNFSKVGPGSNPSGSATLVTKLTSYFQSKIY